MSTHTTFCIVCIRPILCTSEDDLNCGGKRGEAGCENPPFINFCSEACFHELERRMVHEWTRYIERRSVPE